MTRAAAAGAGRREGIERNWRLEPLTVRSRDNLPNPVAEDHNPYVPRNGPAIGDLFEMFDFGQDIDDDAEGHPSPEVAHLKR